MTDQDKAYIATLERDIIADHRGTGRLAVVFLALIFVMLLAAWLQFQFPHVVDTFKPLELS
jgi:hypothetical protein